MQKTKHPQLDVPNNKSGARAIHLGNHIYYYSNDTLIGYGLTGLMNRLQKCVRISGSIETIRRHQHELGIEHFERVDDLDDELPVLRVQ